MIYPGGKKFAFTIMDDTDFATIENVKPVYDFLLSLGFKTSKSVWVYESKDEFRGDSLQDANYLAFIKELHQKGVEIFLHSVGSGDFKRKSILEGFDVYKSFFGEYPKLYANHSVNRNNIYWEPKYRFVFPLGPILGTAQNVLRRSRKKGFHGDFPGSDYFWGDFAKKHIKYIRNLTFNELNTLKVDPLMPYRIKKLQKFANYFFSASDGHTVVEFCNLVSKKAICKLEQENGIAIVYTHLACGFFENGRLNATFEENMRFLASRGGWFAPVSSILDYLVCEYGRGDCPPYLYLLNLNIKWIVDRLWKAFLFRK